jgi:MFS family permease
LHASPKVLAIAFCGFSVFTALTPLGQSTFMMLLTMRFFVGAFESVTIPALTSLNSRWIPRAEFARAQTLSLSGLTIGQMIAYPLTTWIILHWSWPLVFYVNAALGFVWAVVWLRYATDTPETLATLHRLPPRTIPPPSRRRRDCGCREARTRRSVAAVGTKPAAPAVTIISLSFV